MVLVSGSEIDFTELPLHVFQFSVKLMTYEIKLLIFFTEAFLLPLNGSDTISEVFGIESNMAAVHCPRPGLVKFLLQSLDLNSLKHHHKRKVIGEISPPRAIDTLLNVRPNL